MVTPPTSTLPPWVVLFSTMFLRDVEKITSRIVDDAELVVARTIAASPARP